MPSWPYPLAPQQYAAPVVVRPQLCKPPPTAIPPRATAENVRPPVTATGTELEVVEPSPNWPSELSPQQYAAPVVASPQVCHARALTADHVRAPVTAWGTDPKLYEPPAISP